MNVKRAAKKRTAKKRTAKFNLPTFSAEGFGLLLTPPMIFIGCLLINLFPMADSAWAHVKWFVTCNVSDDPLPIAAVFTKMLFLFGAMFLTLFYFGCEFEQTALGAAITRCLNRLTRPLHRRTDELLRAVAAIAFALLWADGGLILTPELKADDPKLSVLQLLIPLYLFGRATLPAAGAGILMLYGYGAVTYGLFHMLDYPMFIGLGVYFILSISQRPELLAFRLNFLRWSVALSLLWPSMEKFVYPAWVAPIAITHPELTLGFDVGTVLTAAGVVEFGLAFALFWTPLVRRLAALALTALLTAATFDFGKVDGIGHLMIIAVLLIVIADPGRQHPGCRPLLAPLVSSAAWLATVLLYTGGHALVYKSQLSALLSLAVGAAALGFIFYCVQSGAQVASGTTARTRRPPDMDIPSGRAGGTPGEGLRGASAASAGVNWPDVAHGHRGGNTAPGFAGVILPDAIDRYRDGAAWDGIFPSRTRTQTD
jgi:hypothetical protein